MIEAIQQECNRVREIIKIYEALPGGAGIFGATWMKDLVKRSEAAIAEADAAACVGCLKELREVES